MIDVNWDLAPEGAEELVQFESHVTWRKGIKIWCMVQEDWRDYVSDFKTIATRPTQTKTVADAVEQEPHFKATRENLDKIAKDAQGEFVEVEQESEKWTHEYGSANIKCRILATDENECWVLTEYGNKVTEHIDELKPIKPTITKAEREKCAALAGYFNINPVEFDEYMEKYDSAEGPAND